MKKIKIGSIVSYAAIAAIAGGLVFGNIECKIHSEEITSHLSPSKEVIKDTEQHEKVLAEADEVVQRIAEEGCTLLKNNGTLPLQMDNSQGKCKVNLFGAGSKDSFSYTGIGSGAATINDNKKITLRAGLEAAGFVISDDTYGKDPAADASVLTAGKAFSDVAIVTISRQTGENRGGDELTPVDSDGRNKTQLSVSEENMINKIADEFSKTIVLINSGNTMELGLIQSNNKIGACLYISHPGQSGTKGIGKILSGAVNPSGHLTDTFVYDNKKDSTYANLLKSNNQVTYAEGIYSGYKWYETADYEKYFDGESNQYGTGYNAVVQYPFGYGLSYTTFDWNVKSVSRIVDEEKIEHNNGDVVDSSKTKFSITVEVTNTGTVAGKDVVEVYYTAPYTKGGIEKAYVNLVEFGKTKTIQPGDKDEVTIDFDLYDMASYDCYDANNNGFKGWELDPGEYHIRLMEDAHTAKKDITFNIANNNGRGIIYRFDPTGKGYVSNRFTGDTAEAGYPIDGSKNNGDAITWMTRSNFKDTFPSSRTPNRTNPNTSYYGDVYDNMPDLVAPQLNNTESNLKLFTLDNGNSASKDQLNKRTGLKANEELILELGKDYKSSKWTALLSQLSIGEIDYVVSSGGFGSKEIESIGKPYFLDYDGPTGFNKNVTALADASQFTGYPAATLVGMTWNKEIAYEQGANLGKEGQACGISGIYGPTVNLHRSPYYTRNFEAYSEDGVLSGYMAANYIKGAKEHGIYAYLKHMVLSDPGQNPGGLITWTTEQHLRENALKAFEIGVKDGGANAIMTAFNNVGSTACSYSYALLQRVLRNEWGFKGSVITDYGVGNPSQLIRSGNDFKLNPNNGTTGLSASNKVDVYCGVQAIHNILYTYCNTYATMKAYNPTTTITFTERVQPFVWWVPTLIAVDVAAVIGLGFWGFMVTRSIVKGGDKKKLTIKGK